VPLNEGASVVHASTGCGVFGWTLPMNRSQFFSLSLTFASLVGPAVLPSLVSAGGPELPADGTKGLGRGGARAARADEPSIMTRNPAGLALLWDDQATAGIHIGLAEACFQPTGGFAWGLQSMGRTAYDLGQGPVYPFAGPGDTYLNGAPLDGFANEPYPRVCYEGPTPLLPYVAISHKLSDDLGVGLGFFPPDSLSLFQWGNRDGTVDTPKGRRPNPLRYLRSHQNVSYFSMLGAAGYRLNPWLSIGAGFQWSLLVYEATTWTTPVSALDPESDVRGDLFGRDLFIPGVIASVHMQPIDALDIVFGFKWSDRVHSNVKLDATTGAFGTGGVFQFNDASAGGQVATVGSSIPTTTHNLRGQVSSPPIWVPQLTAAVRYSDLLRPRARDRSTTTTSAERPVEDQMATERFDLEVDFIYYLTSAYDRAQFTTGDAQLTLLTVDPSGAMGSLPASPGDCVQRDPTTNNCIGDRLVKTDYNGKNQFTVRVGGDYNILPGVLALRAGVSYETRGQDPADLNVLNYMLSRTGIHAGVTLRVSGKTDFTIGYAHFIHENIRLQVFDAEAASRLPPRYRTPEYHFAAGAGVPDMVGNGATNGGFDGTAGVEIPNADPGYAKGPFYVNAGKFFYHLDLLSVSLTQHF
jgi:hypothetical protein